MTSLVKKTLIITAIMISFLSAQSQDLIVTTYGDSLNVAITNQTGGKVYFSHKHGHEIRHIFLNRDQITGIIEDFYSIPEVPALQESSPLYYPRLRIALGGGFTYLTPEISDDLTSAEKDYIKELKTGGNYNLAVTGFFNEVLGLGIRVNQFRTAHELNGITVTLPDGSMQLGRLRDDVKTTFIGPELQARFLSKSKKSSFYSSIGMGYLGYLNNAVLVTDIKITGATAGLFYCIGYDYTFTENLAIGFEVSYVLGSLSKITLNDGTRTETIEFEDDYMEGLSHINLSIGLRFLK